VVSLRIEVLSFKQKEKESLGTAWACLNDLVNSGPNLAIQDHILLQHFYVVLMERPHSFLIQLLEVPSCIALLVKGEISLENIPHTSIHDNGLEDVVEKTPEEEPVIVETVPLTTPLEASIVLQVPEPPKEEEIPPLENILEFKDELFSDFENTLNYSAIRKSSAKSAPN
jgi:hypothetical protein